MRIDDPFHVTPRAPSAVCKAMYFLVHSMFNTDRVILALHGLSEDRRLLHGCSKEHWDRWMRVCFSVGQVRRIDSPWPVLHATSDSAAAVAGRCAIPLYGPSALGTLGTPYWIGCQGSGRMHVRSMCSVKVDSHLSFTTNESDGSGRGRNRMSTLDSTKLLNTIHLERKTTHLKSLVRLVSDRTRGPLSKSIGIY